MSFSYQLLDSLQLDFSYIGNDLVEEAKFELLNPNLKRSNSSFRFTNLKTFDVLDAKGITLLGTANGQPSFIRKKIGKGSIYLHNASEALVNFNLLTSNNHLYAEGVLSYIQTNKVVWFDSASKYDSEKANFPLRFILDQPALRWAWYFFLGGFVIFIVFNIKRKQRVVPIIPPVENTSVDFAKTIANLYYLENNHADLMHKMIVYFLEHTRLHLRLDTFKLDAVFIEKYHLKTSKEKEDIEKVVQLILEFRKTNRHYTEKELNTLYKSIEKITN